MLIGPAVNECRPHNCDLRNRFGAPPLLIVIFGTMSIRPRRRVVPERFVVVVRPVARGIDKALLTITPLD